MLTEKVKRIYTVAMVVSFVVTVTVLVIPGGGFFLPLVAGSVFGHTLTILLLDKHERRRRKR